MNSPSVVFMGTPEFAVPSLKNLIEKNFEIRLVVTQPDRAAGRGQKLTPPPIKLLAEQTGLEIFQPENIRKDPQAIERIRSVECDFLVVVAFGQILPKQILEYPRIAPLNVHASLLPAYRGAAPIARSIMEGEEKTGVTIQWMIEALDLGDVLFQIPCAIEETDTAASLHDRLSNLGAEALISTLELFKRNQIVRRSQDARIGSYASKLEKAEAQISFNQPAFFVHRAIMGMNPWPVAQCQLMGKTLRIFRSRVVARPSNAEPGTVIDTSEGEIVVSCIQGCVALLEVQTENRKRMAASEFLKGNPIPNGLILGGKG